MIQIRRNVFETNSSSSHSLIMMKNDKPLPQFIEPGYYVNDKGEINFWEDDLEFGRAPFNMLVDWYHRLCYVFATYADDKETREKVEAICYSRIIGLTNIKFPKNSWYNNTTYYGCIDHQSMGLLESFLKDNDISLEDFIFNDRYVVVIDGDEYCIFDTLRSLPIWDNKAVEKIMGTYGYVTD